QALGSLGAAAGEAVARLQRAALVGEVLLLDSLQEIAAFLGRNIEQAELRIVGRGLPVLAAEVRRAQACAFRIGARAVTAWIILLDILGGIIVDRPAGLRIEAGRPVQLVG